MKFKAYSALLISAFLGLVLFAHKAEAAFGISPPFINAEHLVKGAEYTQTIYLIQDQPNAEMGIKTTFDVPEKIKSWIKVDKGESFIIPQGVQQYPVQITVSVPQNTDLGVYGGRISFTTQPAKTGQVTIALGAQVILNLTVGNEIYEKFEVPIVKPMDIEEGWDPRVLVRFSNLGNVPEAFTGATFELFDQYGAVRLAYAQKGDGFPETPPFKQQEYVVEFPIDFHLGVGQYWANVVFYKGDAQVASQKTVFNVLKAGTLNGGLAQIVNYLKKNQAMVLGILILLILIIAFIAGKRRRR